MIKVCLEIFFFGVASGYIQIYIHLKIYIYTYIYICGSVFPKGPFRKDANPKTGIRTKRESALWQFWGQAFRTPNDVELRPNLWFRA